MGLFKKSKTEKMWSFWRWFERNEDRTFRFEEDQEAIFDEIRKEIRRVDPDLCFEISGEKEGKREFVVSAGGIRTAFPSVSALCNAKPQLPRWIVIPFRQRMTQIMSIEIGGIKVDPDGVTISHAEDGGKIAVIVYIPGVNNFGAQDKIPFQQAMYLMLDQAVGEFEVETKISSIELADPSEHPDLARVPIAELPNIVDQLPSPIN